MKVSRAPIFLGDVQTSEDKDRALSQYHILADNIAKSNEIRESSNNFWIAVNTFAVSIVGYLVNTDSLRKEFKPFLISLVLIMGMVFCISWFSALLTVKKTVEVRNDLISEIEKFLPIKVFRHYFYYTGRNRGKNSLTAKELLVPAAFFVVYVLFGMILFIYGRDIST